MVTLFESFILLFVEVDRFFIYLNMNKLLDERKLNKKIITKDKKLRED